MSSFINDLENEKSNVTNIIFNSSNENMNECTPKEKSSDPLINYFHTPYADVQEYLSYKDESSSNIHGVFHSNTHFDSLPEKSNIIETSEEKQQRELEESEQLARMLMEEESMSAYHMQLRYLNDNEDMLDPIERAAIQNALREVDTMQNENNLNENSSEVSEDMSYDHLLELGQALGDVKSERWKQISKLVIDKLHVINKDEIKYDSNIHIEDHCSICIEPYDSENLLVLYPCMHCFHELCGKSWGTDHNSCPICKTKIMSSP